jgi:hypothetical protein
MTNQNQKGDDHSHLKPQEQLPNVDFCIASPPPWRKSLSLLPLLPLLPLLLLRVPSPSPIAMAAAL